MRTVRYKSDRYRLGRLALTLIFLSSFPLLAMAQAPSSSADGLPTTGYGWTVFPTTNRETWYTVDFANPTRGWVAGGSGTLAYYDGTQWTPTSIEADDVITAIDLTSTTSGWGCTSRGDILSYSSSTGWKVHSRPIEAWLDDILITGSGGWAVGQLGKILKYQAPNWQQAADLELSWLDAVDFGSLTQGWAVGAGGMARCNNGVWTVHTTLPGKWFHDVDMWDTSNGWAVGENGVIYHWNGSAWSQASSPTTVALNGVYLAAADDGWAVGRGGTILHYDGQAWSLAASPTSSDLNAIVMLSSQDGWAAGQNGTILHYTYTPSPDLSTSSKQVDKTHAAAGEVLSYTIRVRNTGDGQASSVVVSDTLDLGLVTYVPGSATTSQGTIQGPNPLVVTVGNVPAGGEVTITFQVTVIDQGLSCWFVPNQAIIGMAGEQLTRHTTTTVGNCQRVYLPLVFRSSP